MKQIATNLLLLLLLMTACQVEKNAKTSTLVRVETQGDSIRIETEVRDCITLKRVIDLKGTSDDGFDNSYEVYLSYEERKNQNLSSAYYKFTIRNYTFSFNTEEVINFCEKRQEKIEEQGFGNNHKERIEWVFAEKFGNCNVLVKEKEIKDEIHPADLDFWKVELINHCNYSVIDDNNERPKSILIEHYETSFSGGRNLLVLTAKNDTLELLNHNDWMK